MVSPSATSHSLPMPYSQAPSLPSSINSFPHSYTVPPLGSQYSQNEGRSLLGPSYTGQFSTPNMAQTYAGSSSTPGRRRSSDANTGTFAPTHYPTRPRANTSFSSLYQSSHNMPEYEPGPMPTSFQPSRPSWDLSLRSEPESISHDLYKLPGRQNSQA